MEINSISIIKEVTEKMKFSVKNNKHVKIKLLIMIIFLSKIKDTAYRLKINKTMGKVS